MAPMGKTFLKNWVTWHSVNHVTHGSTRNVQKYIKRFLQMRHMHGGVHLVSTEHFTEVIYFKTMDILIHVVIVTVKSKLNIAWGPRVPPTTYLEKGRAWNYAGATPSPLTSTH